MGKDSPSSDSKSKTVNSSKSSIYRTVGSRSDLPNPKPVVKPLIQTEWVLDKTLQQLLNHYYEHLKQDQSCTRAQALRKAQLEIQEMYPEPSYRFGENFLPNEDLLSTPFIKMHFWKSDGGHVASRRSLDLPTVSHYSTPLLISENIDEEVESDNEVGSPPSPRLNDSDKSISTSSLPSLDGVNLRDSAKLQRGRAAVFSQDSLKPGQLLVSDPQQTKRKSNRLSQILGL